MVALETRVELGAFSCELGDRERTPDSIEGLVALCASKGLTLGLSALGCKTFWQMTGAIEPYVARAVTSTLTASGVAAADVSHIVFSTMDKNLRNFGTDFARDVLVATRLERCTPVLISMRQCASSLAAVEYAHRLFANPAVHHVLLVALDFVVEDAERVQPFALFGDAVTSAMMTRSGAGGLTLLSYGMGTDYAGLTGRDNFDTRKQLVASTLAPVLEQGGARIEQVEKCFSTNFFKPVALFNAAVSGVRAPQLGIDTLSTHAHCGNCDWMLNLVQHREQLGLSRGNKYLAQAFAPGFFACALLQATA